jgi:uncharacterized hydrophobic protein (TIGR00271 family)
MDVLRNITDDNRFVPEDVPAFEAKLFFEGAERRVNLERFAVLLFLSTVIATYGIIGDSTATVIGAMIIAPLMRPIMATAAALVMGDMKRALRSFLVVVAGVTGVIGLAWLLTEINVATVVSIETNSQIIGRISPRLIDLYAALAAGAAGAFAMSRDDVADSLPGVAIAISLVPPLCVVGVGLAEGEGVAAWRAVLLFLTNLLSILLAGGGVLTLLGLGVAATKGLGREARRRAFILVAIGVFLVAIPLGMTTWRVYKQSVIKREAAKLAQEWMAGTSYEISRVDASGDEVVVVVYGSGNRPALSELGHRLDARLHRQVDLSLIVVPSEHQDYTAVNGSSP